MDWNDYDMKKPVMKTPLPEEDVEVMARKIYQLFFTPKYIANRVLTIRSLEDIQFILRGVKKVIGHVKDFSMEKMRLQYHFVASLILILIFLYFTRSSLAFLLCFLAGFLLDVDHILDFWLYKRRIAFGREIFQEFCKSRDKIIVLLHSIELLIPLWAFAYISRYYLFSLAITTEFVFHLH